jgi:hypothetical protein
MVSPQQGQAVNISQLVKTITRSALGAVVFLVFLLSVLAATEVTWSTMLFAALKAFLAGVLGQVFLLIIFDTVVRSIVASANEAQAKRRDGGLLFHFLKPDPDEITGATATEGQAI